MKQLSIEALIEEIKPVVMQQFDFKYREKSITLVLCGFRYYQEADARYKIDIFPVEQFAKTGSNCFKTWWRKQKLRWRWNIRLISEINQNEYLFLYFSDSKGFDARTKMTVLRIELSSGNLAFLVENLMEVVEIVVTKKLAFDCPEKSKRSHLWEVSDFQDSSACNKIVLFTND